MKIRLLKNVQIPDHAGVGAGDVFDIAAERGELLIRNGSAEALSDPIIVVRDPLVENRDPVLEPVARKQLRKSA